MGVTWAHRSLFVARLCAQQTSARQPFHLVGNGRLIERLLKKAQLMPMHLN